MMLPKSIRWRLQLWVAFLLVCILSGFGITAYRLHWLSWEKAIDEELERRVSALNTDATSPPPFGPQRGPSPMDGRPDGPPPRRFGPEMRGPAGWLDEFRGPRELRFSSSTLRLFGETETNGYYYVAWSRGGTLLAQSTNAPAKVSVPSRRNAGTRIHTRMNETTREAYQFSEFGECVLAGRMITADLNALQRFAGWLVLAGAAVLALGLGGGWVLATGAIRPVEAIGAAASRISAGNLSERIDVADTDSELGRLAGVLNSTFARLETSFAQQKQFTADASHELRTPLAVLISEAQTTLARERSAAEYRETLEGCLETAQQMRRLAHSLLELARFDSGQESLERTPFDVAERVRTCVEFLRPLADQRALRIQCDLAPVEATADPDRIGQVLTNLLTNAIQYTPGPGEIRVSTRADRGGAVVTVADTGPGIAADDVPHVFERFFSADKSRAGRDGRAGLGLAICKAIIDAHGGTMEVASEKAVGTTFTVRLP